MVGATIHFAWCREGCQETFRGGGGVGVTPVMAEPLRQSVHSWDIHVAVPALAKCCDFFLDLVERDVCAKKVIFGLVYLFVCLFVVSCRVLLLGVFSDPLCTACTDKMHAWHTFVTSTSSFCAWEPGSGTNIYTHTYEIRNLVSCCVATTYFFTRVR